MEQELFKFATHYSLERVKLSTINFDLDYRRDPETYEFYLHQEKAIIRTLGKVTKVPIGETETYKTYEEAEIPVKKKWQEYYKNVRAKRSSADRKAEAERQAKYRQRKKQEEQEFERRR